MMSGIGIPTSHRRMGIVFLLQGYWLALIAELPSAVTKTAAFRRR